MRLLSNDEIKAGCQAANIIQMRGWGIRANSPLVGKGALVEVKVQGGEWSNAKTGESGQIWNIEASFVQEIDDRSEIMNVLDRIMGEGPIGLYEDIFAQGFRNQFAAICCQGNMPRARTLMPAFKPEAEASTSAAKRGCANRETEVAVEFQDIMSNATTKWSPFQRRNYARPRDKAAIHGRELAKATTIAVATHPTQQGISRINRSKGEQPALDALLAGCWILNREIQRRSFRPKAGPRADERGASLDSATMARSVAESSRLDGGILRFPRQQ